MSALLIWWTLHDVSLREVWERVSGVSWLPFVTSIVLVTLTFPLRTVRWQYLLRLEGEKLPFIPLWHATAIGFMATNLLPARAGELARAYAARRLTGVRFTSAIGSLVVERVFDAMSIVTLLVVAMWVGGFGAETEVGNLTLGDLARLGAGAGMLGLLVATVFVRWPQPALRAVESVSERALPEVWARRLVDAVEGVLSGLDSLRSFKRFLAVAFWSLTIWLTGAASFWVGFTAFGIEVPWSAGLLVQTILALGLAIQFSPGFFGQFEAVCRVTLALYAIGAEPAVSFAFGFHLGGFIPITLLGLWSLSRAHLHLADLRSAEGDLGA